MWFFVQRSGDNAARRQVRRAGGGGRRLDREGAGDARAAVVVPTGGVGGCMTLVGAKDGGSGPEGGSLHDAGGGRAAATP